MKKEMLLLTLITTTVVSVSAQQRDSMLNNTRVRDTSTIIHMKNEVGIFIGGYHFNCFAPEWYLSGFNLCLSPGVTYKRNFNSFSVRTGFSYSTQTLNSAGGKWLGENFITGKEEGSMAFAGLERTFYQKGVFQFYAGVDLPMADYSFNGYSVSYDETSTSIEKKQMNSLGVNPFYGVSFRISYRLKISAESNIDNWLTKDYTTMTDPTRVVMTRHFMCAPNPLNAVYLSLLF